MVSLSLLVPPALQECSYENKTIDPISNDPTACQVESNYLILVTLVEGPNIKASS